MKTKNLHSLVLQLHSPLKSVWQRCVVAGAREVEELRSRSGPRCPHCNGHLILRRVGFGPDAGKQFWDCSNVPRCSVSLSADDVTWPEAQSPFAAAA
ncbi:MAG TPA: hypothetical protein VK530_12435 [Candidatus Acidoferrum sp.]|nr:hypothetical protein [Candidatus Acidoferrum sp.]